MKHAPFLGTDFLLFSEAKVEVEPLIIISNKIPELESLGLKEGLGSQLTINQTRDLISLIWAHISFSVSFHILILHFMPTITFRQRQGAAYWPTQSYCMLYQI
jgi:hypothetical protein